MASIFSFTCRDCGKIHEGSPSIAYSYPDYYGQIPEEERSKSAKLSSDGCVIHNKDFFIRVCLEIPIDGISESFLWGVWISVSQRNFARYFDTWDAPDENDSYFGWLSNKLPYYPDTINIKTNAHPRNDGTRPRIDLELSDHPLSLDYHNGISIARAQEIAEYALHQ